MSRPRLRRPMLALIVLIIALVIGYTVRALQSDDDGGHPQPTTSSHP